MPQTPRAPLDRAAARRRLQRRRLTRTVVRATALVAVAALVLTRGSATTSPKPAGPSTTAAAGQTTSSAPTAPVDRVRVATGPLVLPAARSRPAVVGDGDALLVLGGLIGPTPGTSTDSVLRLDPGAGTVTAAGALAVASHDAAAASLPAGVVVFGGGAATTIDTVQAYRPNGSRAIGHLPRPRSDVVATSIAGRAYVLGGFDGTAAQAEVLSTEDGTTFSVVARLPVPVRYPGIATVGSTIYLLGGTSGDRAVDDIQAIDVTTGSARVVGHLPAAVSDAMAFTLRGSVFLAGGLSGGTPRTAIERIDLTTGSATSVGSLPSPVADAGVGQIGDSAYLIGGEGPGRLSSVVVVSPG